MLIYAMHGGKITIDPEKGCIVSVRAGGAEWLNGPAPLFTVQLRDAAGNRIRCRADEASSRVMADGTLIYRGFPADLTVRVMAEPVRMGLDWHISIENRTALTIEWVDFPTVVLKPLRKNGGEGEILFPYNEGALVDDLKLREQSAFRHMEPEYPSLGAYAMFPNMICSQFMCYMTPGKGLYMGAHDAGRAPKGVDFAPYAGGVAMTFRLFSGVEPGADDSPDFAVRWEFFDGGWEDGAEIYRSWFEAHLPNHVKKMTDNSLLPAWYSDSPLVITYPVRGHHDMDIMEPNAFFPYCRALPMIDEIAARTGWRILVVLMHWEGTAPWAPPYVWPPYGGECAFNDFLCQLHQKGHLLGVYCSGFGYTERSNLIPAYDNAERIKKHRLKRGMCAAPGGAVLHSRICTGQRTGYDICVKSEVGRQILGEAYMPLFQSGVDYAQILDQNHGGGPYFCYSNHHGHPPVPGKWMTDAMRELLDSWNQCAPNMLFGCESAAAEPFIGNLLFSDNRFELNWHIGRPVPLYAYLYHEYLRGFMGNQVSCPFDSADEGRTLDTLRMRMAYAFTAGDSMTLVMTPAGSLMANWGCRDFIHCPDFDKTMDFAANMRRLYDIAKPFLWHGRMIKPLPFRAPAAAFELFKRTDIPSVFSSAWEADGRHIQLFVNHTDEPVVCSFQNGPLVVPARDGVMIDLDR